MVIEVCLKEWASLEEGYCWQVWGGGQVNVPRKVGIVLRLGYRGPRIVVGTSLMEEPLLMYKIGEGLSYWKISDMVNQLFKRIFTLLIFQILDKGCLGSKCLGPTGKEGLWNPCFARNLNEWELEWVDSQSSKERQWERMKTIGWNGWMLRREIYG